MEKHLIEAHKRIERGGELVCFMIVKRKFRKSWTEEAIKQLKSSVQELEQLISENK